MSAFFMTTPKSIILPDSLIPLTLFKVAQKLKL